MKAALSAEVKPAFPHDGGAESKFDHGSAFSGHDGVFFLLKVVMI